MDRLKANGRKVQKIFGRHLNRTGIPYRIVAHGTLFEVVFSAAQVRNYRDVIAADAGPAARMNKALTAHGILKSPGDIYPCLSLTEADFDLTEVAVGFARDALRKDLLRRTGARDERARGEQPTC